MAEGLWDTPESAKAVLSSLANHREDLEGMKLPDGSTAAETLQRGLDDAQGGTVATPAAVAVLEHLLYHQDQVRMVWHSSPSASRCAGKNTGLTQNLQSGAAEPGACCSCLPQLALVPACLWAFLALGSGLVWLTCAAEAAMNLEAQPGMDVQWHIS